MRADRIVAAVRRFLLEPDEQVTQRFDLPDRVVVGAGHDRYEAFAVPWRIREADWVEDALLVSTKPGSHLDLYYGLLLERDGGEYFLNDRVTIARLGRRLATDLDPLAYAELLAALYTGDRAGRAIVHSGRPGHLVDDPEKFLAGYPMVDPALVEAPVVRRARDETTVDFLSYRRYPVSATLNLDVVAWTVTAPSGGPARWTRRPVAERLRIPLS